MGDMHDTQFITLQENTANAAQVLEQVYIALTEKGITLSIRSLVILCQEIQPILPATRMPEA